MTTNRSSLSSVALLSIASLLGVACSSSSETTGGGARGESARVGQAKSAVIAGKDSDKSQDDVILLVHYDPHVATVGSCSGTLLSDRVILTARHCVADTDESAACDVTGAPLAEGAVRGNHPANTLYVFVGQNRPDFENGDIKPDGIGMQVLDDGGKNLCNHDIALLILKDPIPNAKIAQLRLESPVKVGEKITAVGWGVTDTSPEPATRQQRSGVEVVGIGPDDSSPMAVPPNEFEVGESICSGDSGGPAFSAKTGAIIGIVSRGGNSSKPDPNDPAKGCIGAENLYTKVAPFKDFIINGLKIVDADPWEEGGPDPRLLKPGSACTDASECRSNLCLADASMPNMATVCTDDCSETQMCPDGQVCTAVGDAQICRAPAPPPPAASPTTTTTTGCAAAPAGSAPSNGLLGFALAALGLVALRRRRS